MGEDALAGALVGNDVGGVADVTCLPGSLGGGGARVWTGHVSEPPGLSRIFQLGLFLLITENSD